MSKGKLLFLRRNFPYLYLEYLYLDYLYLEYLYHPQGAG